MVSIVSGENHSHDSPLHGKADREAVLLDEAHKFAGVHVLEGRVIIVYDCQIFVLFYVVIVGEALVTHVMRISCYQIQDSLILAYC